MKKNEVAERMVNGVKVMSAKDTLNSVSAFLDMDLEDFAIICDKRPAELTPIDKLSLYATKVDFVGRLDNKSAFARAVAIYSITKNELYSYAKDKSGKAYLKYDLYFKDKFGLAKSTISEIIRTCDCFISVTGEGEYYFSELYQAFSFTTLLKLSVNKDKWQDIKLLIADSTIKPSMSSKEALKALADATAVVVDAKEVDRADAKEDKVDAKEDKADAKKDTVDAKEDVADAKEDTAEKLIAVSFTRAEWERVTKQLDYSEGTKDLATRIVGILKASNK